MRDTIFLYIIAILAFVFGFINFIQYLLKRNQTARVVGTIISIKTPNPQNSKFRNSKWATFSYKVTELKIPQFKMGNFFIQGKRKNLSIAKQNTSTYGITSWNYNFCSL